MPIMVSGISGGSYKERLRMVLQSAAVDLAHEGESFRSLVLLIHEALAESEREEVRGRRGEGIAINFAHPRASHVQP